MASVNIVFKFDQYGQSRAWISELLPHTASVVDDLCIIKTMFTEAINHDPALTFFQTGAQVGNRPSMGSWVSYGLGTENKNLPAFCVLLSKGKGNGQGVYSKLWSNGFLDSFYQGVQFSSGENPVLYLNNPDAISRTDRRNMLDKLAELNDENYKEFGDPEITAKVQQYELAYQCFVKHAALFKIGNQCSACLVCIHALTFNLRWQIIMSIPPLMVKLHKANTIFTQLSCKQTISSKSAGY